MSISELETLFRRLWTKDLQEILDHIENKQRPASLAKVITDDPVENSFRAGMIREIIAQRASSVLTRR